MRTLVVSDIHLCGVVDKTGPWMEYRQRASLPDDALCALIRSVTGPSTEIVLNGDIFDFDAPNVSSPDYSVMPVRERSEAASAALIVAILDDHPEFVQALNQAMQCGTRVVFIPGNHDAQLGMPAVERAMRTRVYGPWILCPLFYTTNGFHIEHGHQYDPLCTLDTPPLDNAEDTIGTVVSFYMPLLLGCANPYASDPLDTRLSELLAGVQACSTGGPLQVEWSARTTLQMVRDLMLVTTKRPAGGTTTVGRVPHEHLFAVKTLANELIARKGWRGYGVDARRRLRAAAGQIAGIYGSRGVVMGHTHVPFGETIGGVFFGNSGSWAPGHAGSFVWIDGGRAETRSQ